MIMSRADNPDPLKLQQILILNVDSCLATRILRPCNDDAVAKIQK